jgi:hypothetical protein
MISVITNSDEKKKKEINTKKHTNNRMVAARYSHNQWLNLGETWGNAVPPPTFSVPPRHIGVPPRYIVVPLPQIFVPLRSYVIFHCRQLQDEL